MTHWKQELFILDEGFSLSVSHLIEGEICISRNSYWRRHYNIDIKCQVDEFPQIEKTFNRWREKTKNKYENVGAPTEELPSTSSSDEDEQI